MSYEERLSEARQALSIAQKHVEDTPSPPRQKFPKGTRVRIADNLGPHMSHFPAGKLATVKYSYAHAYERSDERSFQQYCLDIDGMGEVSWYDEDQLTPVEEEA